MSCSKYNTIWCDGTNCSDHEREPLTYKELQKQLKKQGWTSPSTDIDYCPKCSKKYKENQ